MFPDVPDAPQPSGPSRRRHAVLRHRVRPTPRGSGTTTTTSPDAAVDGPPAGAPNVRPVDPDGARADRANREWPSPLSLETALTDADAALRQTLIDCLSDPAVDSDEPNMLSSLTGVLYTAMNPPDFLAVRTGSSVSGKLWGGFVTAGWVDHDGTNFSWFCAGTQPHAYVGVAVRYGAQTCSEQQFRAREIAMTYLVKSIGQAGIGGGSQAGAPPFHLPVHIRRDHRS
ncbi:hypothetical protein SAMN05892883_1686 [Jatrophihabitans sp. GAS493]|nr:hypothetical protein SAMN05892883_1686 [Jatrophihabitans sp. GAS493]